MKKVLITGGTSGIGHAIANQYLVQGHQVHIITSQKEQSNDNSNCYYHYCDLSKEFNIDGILKENSSLKNIDIAIFSAGKSDWDSFFDTPEDKEKEIINLNTISTMTILKKIKSRLEVGSKTLFISSTSSVAPNINQMSYSISKVSINYLFWGLYKKLKNDGISSTLLIPSTTDTNFWIGNETKMGSNPTEVNRVAMKAIRDLESGKKYSTPTIKSRIQLYMALLLSPALIQVLKELAKGKNESITTK